MCYLTLNNNNFPNSFPKELSLFNCKDVKKNQATTVDIIRHCKLPYVISSSFKINNR